ncbi:uncharacterized protein isoform X2 [Choristoneura fumiferana]|uniref:uncharacterized protein isoform X2 n=1 Tax=Choristoneura fumiferana TaxID=7141 RepID=UPI003D156884
MTTRIERMVFNYGTTNRTDYRNYDIKKSEPTVYKPKTKKEKRVPYLGKDSETVTEYKAKNIPFNLLWKPKPIIRTKPTDVPLKYDKIKDEEREESQRTRPRLVMTPAVSLDDVTDATARDIVCRDIYACPALPHRWCPRSGGARPWSGTGGSCADTSTPITCSGKPSTHTSHVGRVKQLLKSHE